ncbi:MAG TPA: SxtJ family membrane protein [bacterium]|nr:SxtJ family membrane protein [bacterium]
MLIEELKDIQSGKKQLKEFAFVVGGALIVFGVLAWWRHKGFYPYVIVSGVAVIFVGLADPGILKPFQRAWMTLALLIGWVMSRVILTLFFYLGLATIGMTARLFGQRFLDLKFRDGKTTYWIERPRGPRPPGDYEKQF